MLNVVSAGGVEAHPAGEAAGRGRPGTAWSRRGRPPTPALARGERREPVRVSSAVTLPSAGVALPRRVLAAVENFRSPLTPRAEPACRTGALPHRRLAPTAPPPTAPRATSAPPQAPLLPPPGAAAP